VRIRSGRTNSRGFTCTRCHINYHEACFWRVLPLEDFLDYWTWLNETDEDHRDNICAACRQLEGLGKERA